MPDLIVSLIETSFKMVPTICQKIVELHGKQVFVKKLKTFVFGSSEFVQISPAYDKNIY